MSHAVLVLILLPQFFLLESLFQERMASAVQRQNTQSTSESAANERLLLESGQAAKLRRPPSVNAETKIISYNIRWRSGDDLKKLIQLFRADPEIGSATIMALQEVDRHKKRSGKTNTAKLLAEELGLYYAWAAPPTAKPGSEEETGVAILSIYPLSNVRRIVLPHDGPGHRRRVALGVSVKIGNAEWRVYSAHAETRISMAKKLEQMDAVLQDLAQYPGTAPAIVMGDLNTWQPDAARKTIKLFSAAGFKTPFGSQRTFSRQVFFVPLDLRLDWIWLRGFDVIDYGINRKVAVSDHWPLWTNVKVSALAK
jgi:endonuclease/exonuclease/phosphatase family metal-dependent hydrolase